MELESLIHKMYVFYLHVGSRFFDIFTPGSTHVGGGQSTIVLVGPIVFPFLLSIFYLSTANTAINNKYAR